MGIRGAGIATVFSWTLIATLFGLLIFNRENDRRYGVLSSRRLDMDLCRRIVARGVPASLQFTIDVFAFTFFIFAMGRLGKTELSISNIAFSLESLAFMPAVGFSMGLSTLVGQSLGRNDVPAALRFTRQTIRVLLTYIFFLDLIFLFAPHTVLDLFLAAERGNPDYARLLADGTRVLRTMAVFIAFDALYFTFIGVLKGAGDTRFIMWSMGVATLLVMILPLWLLIAWQKAGLLSCWIILTLYVLSLCAVSFWRFRQGRWQKIRVI